VATTSLGCTVITNPSPEVDKIAADCDGLCKEQGPMAKGIPQLADLLLLSHGQYLIGFGASTYFQFIGYLVAYNNLLGNILADKRYIVWPEKFGGGGTNVYLSDRYDLKEGEIFLTGCPKDAAVRSFVAA
jgi:hypothetical protein